MGRHRARAWRRATEHRVRRRRQPLRRAAPQENNVYYITTIPGDAGPRALDLGLCLPAQPAKLELQPAAGRALRGHLYGQADGGDVRLYRQSDQPDHHAQVYLNGTHGGRAVVGRHHWQISEVEYPTDPPGGGEQHHLRRVPQRYRCGARPGLRRPSRAGVSPTPSPRQQTSCPSATMSAAPGSTR